MRKPQRLTEGKVTNREGETKKRKSKPPLIKYKKPKRHQSPSRKFVEINFGATQQGIEQCHPLTLI
jgi:hypothetical protein